MRKTTTLKAENIEQVKEDLFLQISSTTHNKNVSRQACISVK